MKQRPIGEAEIQKGAARLLFLFLTTPLLCRKQGPNWWGNALLVKQRPKGEAEIQRGATRLLFLFLLPPCCLGSTGPIGEATPYW